MKYNYITIEGNIGSGKTSLAKLLAKDFNAKLVLERFEDNSFLPKFYNEPEKYAFTLEMSFLADRFQQLKEELSKQDIFKTSTISDYFIDKSLIFARKTLQQDEFILYLKLFDIINATLPKPELIIFLYTSIDQLKRNILKRGRDYERKIENSYLQKIQSGYIDYFKLMRSSRVLLVNTKGIDFVNNKKDYSKILKLLNINYDFGIHRIELAEVF